MLKYIGIDNGISLQYLAMKVMSETGPTAFTTEEYHGAYEELVKDGEIVRLEFADPITPVRTKTILFSKGTQFLNLQELLNEKATNSKTDMVGESGRHL